MGAAIAAWMLSRGFCLGGGVRRCDAAVVNESQRRERLAAESARARNDRRIGSVFSRGRPFLVTLLLLTLAPASNLAATEWVKLTAPKCTVISEVSAARTRAWALEFELFRRGIGQMLPVDARNVEPVLVVLFASDRRFKPFKPVEQGKPARVGGFFLRSPGKNLIAISVDGARAETRERIFHEATHWHLSAAERQLPLWMEEGLADVFATFTRHGDTFTVGANRPGYFRYLQVTKPMPFARLAAVERGSLNYNGKHADETELFYVQSWATVHLVMLGRGLASVAPVQRFLGGPPGSDPTADAAGLTFGRTAVQMDADLAAYLDRKTILVLKAPLARPPKDADFTIAPAMPGEVDLALGELLLGVGRAPEAVPYFSRAMAAMPDDPRPREGLGKTEWLTGRAAEALARFEESFARGGRGFAGRYLAALAALRVLDNRAAASGQISYGVAVENLAEALRMNPRLREGYELAGVLMAHASGADAERLEAILAEGARRFPACPGIWLGLGFAAVKNDRLLIARAYARRAAEHAPASSLPFDQASRMLNEAMARAESGPSK
jgi:tetratricopeptide (TPR) repeat protein